MRQPLLLQRLLAGHGDKLERLVERAQHIAELDQRLRRHLPSSLVDHLAVANLRDGVLVLWTSTPEWRTRAHFLAPRLLEALQAESSFPIREIKIRVLPVARAETPHRARPKLSPESADLLRSAAESFGDDHLGRALGRLAARLRR